MGSFSYIILIIETLAAWAVLFAVQIPLRIRWHPVLRIIAIIVKVVLIPGTAILFVAVVCGFSYRHGDILNAVYIALIADTAADVIGFFAGLFRRKRPESPGRLHFPTLCGVLSLIFCAALFVYGTWNAGNVTEQKHVWEAEGLERQHTFAFVADIHAGQAMSEEKLWELCLQINAESPEFVILGGDVTDELTSYEDMTAVYRILSEIEAPVYFVYGNHDRQPDASLMGGRTYTDEQLTEEIRKAGIRILSDEFVKISDDLVLLGREDLSRDERIAWNGLSDPFGDGAALVVADHQPYDEDQLAVEVSALQLSGHTHAGQLWPLRAFYRYILGLPAYGEFEEPGTRLYVTAGTFGWMIPMRTERHCEWDLITLQPA